MPSNLVVFPRARRAVRRGLELGCELYSVGGGSRREQLLDLSPEGARVSSQVPLACGEEVQLSFPVPGSDDERVAAACRVVHGAGALDRAVGLVFLDLDTKLRADVAQRLRGLPPPLPPSVRREPIWVDAVVTWDEELADRTNHFAETVPSLALDTAAPIDELDEPFADRLARRKSA